MTLSWFSSHSNGANESFLDVGTAPAGRGSVSLPELGTFLGGVGPVVGADGTVFIGNEQGKVFAIRADGVPAWNRDTGNMGRIAASPIVTANGLVFVVTTRTLQRDHR